MSEPTVISYDFKELATILIKREGIHDGLWCIHVRFGIRGANMGSSDEDVLPTAMVPILRLGIQKTDKRTNLTVDAAEVNPPKQRKTKK